VSDPSKIVSSGEGISQARLYEDAHFEVETAGAGPGDLTSYVEHDGQQKDVEVVKKNETLYDCVFRPDAVGVYNLYVNYNDSPIKGSPFPVKVGNPNEAVVIVDREEVVEAGTEHSCLVKLTEDAGEGDVITQVRGPDGNLVPSHVKYVNNSSREVVFKPDKPGRYETDIYYAGALLQGCPHVVHVQGRRERVDPKKVRVTGPGITEGKTFYVLIVHRALKRRFYEMIKQRGNKVVLKG